VKATAVTILGSTGSIGTQALDVVQNLDIKVTGMTAHRNMALFEQQLRIFRPAYAAVSDEKAAKELKERIADLPVKVFSGIDGVCEVVACAQAEIVLNAIVGMAGLRPTLAAIAAGKTIALANKESLVAGGELVMREAEKKGVAILPVDSEHSAIFQCLQGCADTSREINKIILTASGGPFFGMTRDQLKDVTPEQALRHPNWSMGNKITIDCATLMNKGMELIEAVWLFKVPPEKIQIVVHRESIIHSAVEFADHSVLAHLGVPDMRIPIQYALTYPHRYHSPAPQLDLLKTGKLTFGAPDMDTFKCLSVCIDAINRGGLVPTAANGANEEAVELFLKNLIQFNDIGDFVKAAAKRQDETTPITLESIMKADLAARQYVLSCVKD